MSKDKLHNIKDSGLKVPDGYFSNLEDRFISHIKIGEAETSGLKIPEGYLDTLEDSILDKVYREEKDKVISLFTKKQLFYVSGTAAAILLLLFLGVFNKVDPYSQLDNELVESYIINEDISSYEIASLMLEEDLVEDYFIENSFSEENLEDYLLENINIEDIDIITE